MRYPITTVVYVKDNHKAAENKLQVFVAPSKQKIKEKIARFDIILFMLFYVAFIVKFYVNEI